MSQSSEKQSAGHHAHPQVFDASSAEGRMNWVFYDFWPIMIWVGVFILMCSIPIVLSGMLHNPFSAADVVWWGYGLLIGAVFLGALGLFIVLPQFVAPYVLLVAIYYLIAAEHFKAWAAGGMPWGNTITILFLTYALIGNLIFLRAGFRKKKSRL
jgi:hypothetical protein